VAKLRLTSKGLIDVDFTGQRLTATGIVNGSAAVAGVTATLSGTVTASITESDIVTGGKTIILTLTGDTFVAAGTAFDAQRQAIINGLNGI